MKLNALKAAIKAGANPQMFVNLAGHRITVILQKGPFLATLDDLFPDNGETNLILTAAGYISRADESFT